MLSLYPIKIDGTAIPWPTKWEEESNVVETENQTEGGKDVVDTTRYDKLSVKATFKSTATWAKFFKQKSKANSVTLKRYDVLAEGYEERTMRIRGFKAVLVKGSQRVGASNGIWNITFDLIEF